MSRHWFISHLIDKFSRGKSLGLDIGIGKDNWVQSKNCKMIGIDIKKSSKADVIVDLEGELPFKDNTFDVVIAINSLNYVQNGRNILTEINRVMKNNGTIVCVVDNEKSSNYPNVWEQMYLDRVLSVTGFKSILGKNLKDILYAKWYNRTSVYGFAVAKKKQQVQESYSQNCFKCNKPLGKNWKVNKKTNKPEHISCPVSSTKKQWSKSYNIETTHPDR